jgi:hypothetical protein
VGNGETAGAVVPLVAIDLSAAFDTVDHNILMKVLQERFGIQSSVWTWFRDYLSPRSCVVKVGSMCSTSHNLTFSVPQGSCAGPFLYLAYASTLQEIIPHPIQIHGYADDHAVKDSFQAGNETDEARSIDALEHCLKDINDWMNENRLKMNNSKTEFILFGNKTQLRNTSTESVNVNGVTVNKSNSIKYLGVHLDEGISLKQHVAKKCSIAMANLMRIKLIRKYLNIEAAKTVVSALVLSHLDYANAH